MNWTEMPVGRIYRRHEERGRGDLPLLSVYRDHGVVPREGREDNYNKPSDDLSSYKVVRPGDLVLNKMKTWQGSLGVSAHTGVVSPAYFVGRRTLEADDRFMHHLLRSQPLIAEYGARSKGIRPSQWDLPWEEFASIRVQLPSTGMQRAIADFLDTETARVEAVVVKRRRMVELIEERLVAAARAALMGAWDPGPHSETGLPWLPSAPSNWDTAPIYSRFDVLLGRMVNAERTAAGDMRPYLRNANVRWDRVDVSDVAKMDFPPVERVRYRLEPGDLLVCEGGAGVGRAAVWTGQLGECYFQKSLHRVRPRGEWPVRWLIEWLRVCKHMGVLEGQGNLATIPHLTAEQLREHRVPMPDPDRCHQILDRLDSLRSSTSQLQRKLEEQVRLLSEHRQALITAAVTGELAVPGVAA